MPLASQHGVTVGGGRRRPFDLRRRGYKRVAKPMDRPDKDRPARVVAGRASDVSNEHRDIPIGLDGENLRGPLPVRTASLTPSHISC